ncbi:hypothetical protein BDF19DRAFT_443290 [Syncephalis fuscata]|nr:hypothetical protein BDF19DRAFT_443290 [Syncephalis fuscata]
MLLHVIFLALVLFLVVAAGPIKPTLEKRADRTFVDTNSAFIQDPKYEKNWIDIPFSFGSAIASTSSFGGALFYSIIHDLFLYESNKKRTMYSKNSIAFVPVDNTFSGTLDELHAKYYMTSRNGFPMSLERGTHSAVESYAGWKLYIRPKNGSMYVNCARIINTIINPNNSNIVFLIDRMLSPGDDDYGRAVKGEC